MLNLEQFKEKNKLSVILEALLFVAVSPVSIAQLASALNESEKVVQDTLKELETYYLNERGLCLQWHGKKVQLTSAPEFSPIIENFLGIETTSTLSQAALEALAIIAYRQPITRPQIEEVRGVNSDGVVKNLLGKGLIEEVGRLEGAGRPILYGTTADFLGYFGLSSIKDLPSFDVLPTINENPKQILKD